MTEGRRVTTGHLLAALALVVIGLLIGWATDSGDGGERGEQPTADVGPTRTVDGVPVGYERSREGAVAAVLNYGAALADPALYGDVARLRAAVRAAGTREYVDRYRSGLAEAGQGPLAEAVRRGDATIQKSVPLGYRVLRYTDDEVVVRTWAVGVLGSAGGLDPQAVWGLEATTMRWADGDWKIAAVKTEAAPVPRSVNAPTKPNQFFDLIGGLRGVGYAP